MKLLPLKSPPIGVLKVMVLAAALSVTGIGKKPTPFRDVTLTMLARRITVIGKQRAPRDDHRRQIGHQDEVAVCHRRRAGAVDGDRHGLCVGGAAIGRLHRVGKRQRLPRVQEAERLRAGIERPTEVVDVAGIGRNRAGGHRQHCQHVGGGQAAGRAAECDRGHRCRDRIGEVGIPDRQGAAPRQAGAGFGQSGRGAIAAANNDVRQVIGSGDGDGERRR